MYSFFLTYSIITLTPLILQTSILIAFYFKHKYQELLIKIWSVFLFIGGLASIISILATSASISLGSTNADRSKLEWPNILYAVVMLLAGIYFYTGFKKNIEEVKIDDNDNILSNKIKDSIMD